MYFFVEIVKYKENVSKLKVVIWLKVEYFRVLICMRYDVKRG